MIPPDAAEALRWLAMLCAALVLGALHLVVTARRRKLPSEQGEGKTAVAREDKA
jgi:hypothetical protein